MVMPVDKIVKISSHITHCGRCKDEQQKLNELMTYEWTPDKGQLYCSRCKTMYVYQKERADAKETEGAVGSEQIL